MLFHCLLSVAVVSGILVVNVKGTIATSVVVTSTWELTTSNYSTIQARKVIQRNKVTCAATCHENDQCLVFAFRQEDDSCLVHDRFNGTFLTVKGHIMYVKVAPPGAGCPLQNGYDYNSDYNTCIKTNPNATGTWKQQYALCQSEGGHLYNINNQLKWNALKAHYAKIGTSPKGEFIGATDEVEENNFVWSDGTSANASLASLWEPGQPDNYFDEDYTQLRSDWTINDSSKSYIYGYICEIDLYM